MGSSPKTQTVSSSRALVSSLKVFKHKILKVSRDSNLLVLLLVSIVASSLNLVSRHSKPQISFSSHSSSLSNLDRMQMLSNLRPQPQGSSLYKLKTRLCSLSPWRPPPNFLLISKYNPSKASCHKHRASSSSPASPVISSLFSSNNRSHKFKLISSRIIMWGCWSQRMITQGSVCRKLWPGLLNSFTITSSTIWRTRSTKK